MKPFLAEVFDEHQVAADLIVLRVTNSPAIGRNGERYIGIPQVEHQNLPCLAGWKVIEADLASALFVGLRDVVDSLFSNVPEAVAMDGIEHLGFFASTHRHLPRITLLPVFVGSHIVGGADGEACIPDVAGPQSHRRVGAYFEPEE